MTKSNQVIDNFLVPHPERPQSVQMLSECFSSYENFCVTCCDRTQAFLLLLESKHLIANTARFDRVSFKIHTFLLDAHLFEHVKDQILTTENQSNREKIQFVNFIQTCMRVFYILKKSAPSVNDVFIWNCFFKKSEWSDACNANVDMEVDSSLMLILVDILKKLFLLNEIQFQDNKCQHKSQFENFVKQVAELLCKPCLVTSMINANDLLSLISSLIHNPLECKPMTLFLNALFTDMKHFLGKFQGSSRTER